LFIIFYNDPIYNTFLQSCSWYIFIVWNYWFWTNFFTDAIYYTLCDVL